MTNNIKDQHETQAITRIVLRPYATALPLGCFAFAVGNVLLSAFALHWIPASETKSVALIMLAFVAPLEFVPCIMSFLARDTGGATAMGIFAAAWVVQGVLLFQAGAAVHSVALGLFFVFLAIFLGILAYASFTGKPLLGVLLVVAFSRCVTASFVQFGAGPSMETISAVFGLLLTAFALYAGVGFLMEDVLQKPLAMTFRRGKAKAAMEDDLQDQLQQVSTEAGVRPQL